jgi:hypothetical protein
MKPAFSLLSLLVAFASGVYSQGHLHDGAALMERDELLNVTANGVDLDVEDDGNSLDLSTLEKRKGCTGHREQGDVCKGRLLVKINSRHNWYVHPSESPYVEHDTTNVSSGYAPCVLLKRSTYQPQEA